MLYSKCHSAHVFLAHLRSRNWLRGRSLVPVSTQNPRGLWICYVGPFDPALSLCYLSSQSSRRFCVHQGPSAFTKDSFESTISIPFCEAVRGDLLPRHPSDKVVLRLVLQGLSQDGDIHDQLPVGGGCLAVQGVIGHLCIQHKDATPVAGENLPL